MKFPLLIILLSLGFFTVFGQGGESVFTTEVEAIFADAENNFANLKGKPKATTGTFDCKKELSGFYNWIKAPSGDFSQCFGAQKGDEGKSKEMRLATDRMLNELAEALPGNYSLREYLQSQLDPVISKRYGLSWHPKEMKVYLFTHPDDQDLVHNAHPYLIFVHIHKRRKVYRRDIYISSPAPSFVLAAQNTDAPFMKFASISDLSKEAKLVHDMMMLWVHLAKTEENIRPRLYDFIAPSYWEREGLEPHGARINLKESEFIKVYAQKGKEIIAYAWADDFYWLDEFRFIVVEENGNLYIYPAAKRDLNYQGIGIWVDPWISTNRNPQIDKKYLKSTERAYEVPDNSLPSEQPPSKPVNSFSPFASLIGEYEGFAFDIMHGGKDESSKWKASISDDYVFSLSAFNKGLWVEQYHEKIREGEISNSSGGNKSFIFDMVDQSSKLKSVSITIPDSSFKANSGFEGTMVSVSRKGQPPLTFDMEKMEDNTASSPQEQIVESVNSVISYLANSQTEMKVIREAIQNNSEKKEALKFEDKQASVTKMLLPLKNLGYNAKEQRAHLYDAKEVAKKAGCNEVEGILDECIAITQTMQTGFSDSKKFLEVATSSYIDPEEGNDLIDKGIQKLRETFDVQMSLAREIQKLAEHQCQ